MVCADGQQEQNIEGQTSIAQPSRREVSLFKETDVLESRQTASNDCIAAHVGGEAGAVEVEEDLNAEDDEGDVEDALAEAAEAPAAAEDAAADVKVEWKGASTRQAAGDKFYKYASPSCSQHYSTPDLATHQQDTAPPVKKLSR